MIAFTSLESEHAHFQPGNRNPRSRTSRPTTASRPAAAVAIKLNCSFISSLARPFLFTLKNEVEKDFSAPTYMQFSISHVLFQK